MYTYIFIHDNNCMCMHSNVAIYIYINNILYVYNLPTIYIYDTMHADDRHGIVASGGSVYSSDILDLYYNALGTYLGGHNYYLTLYSIIYTHTYTC